MIVFCGMYHTLYESEHTHMHTHSQTPTNYHPPITSATASTRSIAGSPAVSHEEDFREVIVLAENAKNETLLCPLCQGVFRDPYIATCGVCPLRFRSHIV